MKMKILVILFISLAIFLIHATERLIHHNLNNIFNHFATTNLFILYLTT